MDPITHGLIGATASLPFAEEEHHRSAALVGAAGAMLPDLDVLIDSNSDPLLQLEFHRQFSHSLLFIPVGALLVATIFWLVLNKKLSFARIYLFSFMGIATAGLADTFTSYGVQLLWPFKEIRFAWNLISVFDPLFSTVIVLLLGLTLYQKRKVYNFFALGWLAVYLLFGASQQHQAKLVAQELSEQRGHEIQQLTVKPTIANEVLWSIRYTTKDSLFADGVSLLPFSPPQIYEGNSVELLNWKDRYEELYGSVLYQDIARFSKLSNAILISHPDESHVIGDGRYAMLPTSVDPLWGIRIDTTDPNQHARFITYRDASPKVRNAFLHMLLGR